MIKKICTLGIAAVLTLTLAGTAAYADDNGDNIRDIENMGIRMEYPEELDNLKGYLETNSSGHIAHDPDVYYMTFDYFNVSGERLEEFRNMKQEDFTEEDSREFMTALKEAGMVLACEGGMETLLQVLEVEELPEDLEVTEIGKAGDLCYYYIPRDYSEQLEEPYKSEYREVQAKILDLLKNAEFYVPDDPVADLVGQKISFETTDLEGNPVTSEELFAQNEITMINYWATWCHFCVEEMPELAAIHTRLQEKGCGIIGLLLDGDDPEKLDQAREIAKEKGTNYPTVIRTKDMNFLDNINAFPTSIFVDKEGRILSYPIAGAAVDLYEETVDKLLKGESTGSPAEPAAAANDAGVYRIMVTDTEGNPVSGAVIQFCDDTTCTMGKTDDRGAAVFSMPEKVYDVHVLKVPEGYEGTSEEYHTLDKYSDLPIVLETAG